MHDEPPADLDMADVVDALERQWGLHVESLEHLAVGGGGHHWRAAGDDVDHFVTVDDLGTKDWLGNDHDSTFLGLRTVIDSAAALPTRLPFVAAPLAAADGSAVQRLDGRYALSVSPFLVATPGEFGPVRDPVVRARAIEMVAALHVEEVTAAIPSFPRPVIGERSTLEDFLSRPDRPWRSGPFGEDARRTLRPHVDDLSDLLAAFDLRAGLAAHAPQVLTHGEPHAGNILSTDDRSWLIDWDTLAHAPAERDLWFLVLDDADADRYERFAGARPDPSLLDLYRARWTWDDLAHGVRQLSSPHAGADGDRRELAALPRHLAALLRHT